MNALARRLVTAAAIPVAAAAGYWVGQIGLIQLPGLKSLTANVAQQPTGPIIYYRDPAGRPLYSLTPRSTEDGKAYVAVHASEDASFDQPQAASDAQTGRRIIHYRNPMGLPDISPVPKKDSMGMDYIAVYEGDQEDGNTVKVSPGKLQRTGVKTELVGKLPIAQSIRAPGVIAFDETRLSVVAMRFDGFINEVGPVTSGTHVRKGDPLMSVFGQELLNAGAQLVVEEVTGWKGPERDDAALSGPRTPRGRIVGARRRLENLQVPAAVIEEIKKTRRVPDAITWFAPQDGIVLERNAVDGQAFKAGEVLFRIADHTVVWAMADIPEGDIGAVRPGQAVTVRTRAYPGRTFNGNVDVVYPHLVKETRTARVRIELPNPDLALLPEMYANVEIATGSDRTVVAVPTSSVIDSGSRQVVIADLGDGRFEPRDVKLGRRGADYIEVLDGIQEGDSVVVDGHFLIDAESNLNSALKALTAPAQEAKP